MSQPSLPPAFVKRILERHPLEGPEFLESLESPRVVGLRTNTLKISTEQLRHLLPFNLQVVPWCSEGFYYDYEERPGQHPLYRAGLYYIQEPSAMYTVEALGVKPGDKVLDLCAAPGGKSTQALAKLGRQGLLVANEISTTRANVLAYNLETFGAKDFIVTNTSADKLALKLRNYFDKIIVDAPCSGEGMFRKDPETRSHWDEGHPCGCAERQEEIMGHAISMLRPGGTLVYSTCTFAEEENEWLVEKVLATHPDLLALQPPSFPGVTVNELPSARLLPHRVRGEGHFCALFMKTGDAFGQTTPIKAFKPNAPDKAALASLSDFMGKPYEGIVHAAANNLYDLPEHLPDLTGIRVIRAGLKLGEYRSKYFQPDHALALSLNHLDLPVHNYLPEAPELAAYLRGDVLSIDPAIKGWLLICCQGYALGFGKASGGQIKNHLPKGLRIR